MRAISPMVLRRGLAPVILIIAVTLAGCGKKGLVRSANVTSYTQENQIFTELMVGLNTGNLDLPSVTFPIINPKDPHDEIGKISLLRIVGGGSSLNIALNFSRALQIPGQDGSMLPNGTPIPVTMPDGIHVVSFPVSGGKVKAYFALGQHAALVGAAFPIREFLPLGTRFGNLDLFPGFRLGKISGSVGLFLGPEADQNGLAIFADLSQVVSVEVMRQARPDWSRPGKGVQVPIFTRPMPGRDVQREVSRFLTDYEKRGEALHIE